jgi:hypothetical protein
MSIPPNNSQYLRAFAPRTRQKTGGSFRSGHAAGPAQRGALRRLPLTIRPLASMPRAFADTNIASNSLVVPKGRFELPRPQGTLRPERSASAIPPLRHNLGLAYCQTALLMEGNRAVEPLASLTCETMGLMFPRVGPCISLLVTLSALYHTANCC